MGMCKPSGGVKEIYGPHKHSLSAMGEPNSRVDYYDEETGELIQQRWYDPDGKAEHNRDWNHNNSDNTHEFPHDHSWDWSVSPPRQGMEPVNEKYY